MKPTVTLAIATCLAFSLSTASAQGTGKARTAPQKKSEPVAAIWEQEPTSVFGVKLGTPLPEASIPACPQMPQQGFYDVEPKELCFRPADLPSIKGGDLYGTPDLGFWYRASVSTFDDAIMMLTLSAKQAQFDIALAVLKERYGTPTKTEIREVVAGSGARLNARVVTWTGPRTTITAIERLGTIEDSYIAFGDVATMTKKAGVANDNARAAASKL